MLEHVINFISVLFAKKKLQMFCTFKLKHVKKDFFLLQKGI